MSRIVVTTLGSLGDLHPMIAVALELRQRGHNVVFITHKEYQPKLEALKFEFHRMRPDFTALNDPEEMARMMDLKTGQEYMVRQWVNPNLRAMYTDLLNVAQTADFIFSGEGVTATPLVAEKLKMRWASSAMVPMSFFSAYDPPVLAPRVASLLQELLNNPSYAEKAKKIARILQTENGVGVACDAIEKQLLKIATEP